NMRRSLVEFGSIDMVWRGLPYADFVELKNQDSNGDGLPDFKPWNGPADFKSYLMFNHDAAPWDREAVRRAAALALDRSALASETFVDRRTPLFSPVPDAVPGHVPSLPQRDLTLARTLLQTAGYNEAVPLEIELWYVSDGRYSNIEEAYATAIKTQLEETGIFKVNLASAPFEQFRTQINECNYPAYLLGWPSPGRPVDYLDVLPWTQFFIASNSFCTNYESEIMDDLMKQIREETDLTARLALYDQLQQKWAADLPTLDILQEQTRAISLPNINNLRIDALGMLHYEVLTKGGG
ncbi:MAG: hypothetical protein GY796_33555, partial [Chloroflexi bacterium]|nr:hypothetical protein [Chloroflexota bacterium]